MDEKTLRSWNLASYFHGDVALHKIITGSLDVAYAQGEMAGAALVRLVLEQKVELLVAKVEP